MGLSRAGFDVTGVDIKKQPRYPFRFIQADALQPPLDLTAFDFIWASPPCQAHTAMKTMPDAKPHLDLIPDTRNLLIASGRTYAIENVPGAPLLQPFRLCGTSFGLGVEDAELRRHRLFETSFPVLAPRCQHGHRDVIGIYGGHHRNRRRGMADFNVQQGRIAMGIDWMTIAELCESVPPAYSEFIGRQAIETIGRLYSRI